MIECTGVGDSAQHHCNWQLSDLQTPLQKQQLLLCCLQVLEYAARWHPDQEIISKTVEGPIVVSTYADLAQRARLCAVALQRLGVR